MPHETAPGGHNQPIWPDGFTQLEEPRHTDESLPPAPFNVVDALYLRPDDYQGTTFVGVVGCRDGSLQAVVGNDTTTLDNRINEQLAAVKFGASGVFRGLAADSLSLLSVTFIEQNIATKGLNDPVTLYGYMTSAMASGETSGQQPVARGSMIVGRLDLLQAYRAGIAHRFRSVSPDNSDAYMTSLALPSSVSRGATGGRGVVLAYPAFDPAVYSYGDNSLITRTIIYDLLNRLQHDMVEEGIHSSFTSGQLPVPSREMFEVELRATGYRVDGDEAVKVGPNGGATGKGWIARLRSYADEWSAGRISLPPEASDADYAAIIDMVMPDIEAFRNAAAVRALGSLIKAEVSYVAPVRRRQSALPGMPAASRPATTPHRVQHPAVPTSIPAPAARPAASAADWSQDFTAPAPRTTPATKPGLSRQEWEREFNLAAHMPIVSSASKTLMSASTPTERPDWADDFTAIAPPSPPTAPAAKLPKTTQQPKKQDKGWSSDFEAAPTDPSHAIPPADKQTDWSGDFDS